MVRNIRRSAWDVFGSQWDWSRESFGVDRIGPVSAGMNRIGRGCLVRVGGIGHECLQEWMGLVKIVCRSVCLV